MSDGLIGALLSLGIGGTTLYFFFVGAAMLGLSMFMILIVMELYKQHKR